MAVFSLTNSSARIDQAVSAVHSGLFPNGTGVVYTEGNQSISGNKTFQGGIIGRAGADFSGNISGELSPHSDGTVNLGSASKKFATIYGNNLISENAVFAGDVTVNGSLSANLNIGATGLSTISVSNTGYIQNLRVSGASFLNGSVTITGGITSHGSNTFIGNNSFGAASFSSLATFQNGLSVTGNSTFQNVVFSSVVSGPISQSGAFNSTGTLTHTGNLFQGGDSFFTGDVGVNGNLSATGNFSVVGSNSVRAASYFTTGNSASDRFRIEQNVDVTGDWNQTGAARFSNGVTVLSAGANISGGLTVRGTGNLDGATINGNVSINGTSTLTGTTSLRGQTNISGSTRISGSVEVVGNTGESFRVNNYFRPYIVAQGFGTTSVSTLSISNFWAATTANAVSPGTGIWLTPYSGNLGEMGLFMTGASNTVANNNNLPLGTYGKVFYLTNVGVRNGSGVWLPVGI